jgi:gluconate 5-dehydrogenase
MNVREMFDLHGRVAIVTGGGTHLGRAMAASLGELGAAVFVASRRKELCEQVAAEMREDGIDCTGLGCDVTVEEEVNSLVEGVVRDRGRLDVIVCNAGGSAVPATYVPDGSRDEFEATVELNLTGTYLCAQAAARVMIPQHSGSIITIGSIHGALTTDKRFYKGLDFNRGAAAYQSAKGGILNLTRHLAGELGEHGITANSISPGQMPRPERGTKLFTERVLQNIALGRVGVPDDLKGAVALLASPAGAWITGHNLIVDGGWSIW